MTITLTPCQALDLAVEHANLAQKLALLVEPRSCGTVFPFGVNGDLVCPVCSEQVFMHLGHTDQRSR